MTGNQTLVARSALSLLAGVFAVLATSSSRLRSLPRHVFDRFASFAFLGSRLAVYVLLFLVLRVSPRGDVPSYYLQDADKVIKGLLPYRDFITSYAPLHPYLDSLALRLWWSPLSIILLAILFEALLLPLWLRLGRTFLAEDHLRNAVLLYLTSALSLQFVTVDGQNNVIIAVLLTVSLLLLNQSRFIASGVAVGAGIAFVKFLPLLYCPAFFFAVSKRWRWLLGISLTVCLTYGWFILQHLPVLQPFTVEGNFRTAGDIPFIVEFVTGFSFPSILWDGILVLLLGLLFAYILRTSLRASSARRLHVLAFGLAAITLVFLIFSKKSWPPYILLTLFPTCLLIPAFRIRSVITFAAFQVVALLEHSYWATLLRQFPAQQLHLGLTSGQPLYWAFLLIEVLLVSGYLWLLRSALLGLTGRKQLSATSPSGATSPEALR